MRRWSSNAKHAVQRYVLEFKAAQKRKRLSWRSRPREVKRELIRALAPAAGGLFTGAQWRARVTARKAAKGEPEQEGPLTESAFIWIVPS